MGADRSGFDVLLGLVVSGVASGVVIVGLCYTMRGLRWMKRESPIGIVLILILLAALGAWLIAGGA
jgi:hypothetical protein